MKPVLPFPLWTQLPNEALAKLIQQAKAHQPKPQDEDQAWQQILEKLANQEKPRT